MTKPILSTFSGTIWHLLMKKGQMTMKEIAEYLDKDVLYVQITLGWMARENRVILSDNDGKTYITLNHSVYEQYY